jgi:hypothetical protein
MLGGCVFQQTVGILMGTYCVYYSCLFVPLLVWGRLHTEDSQEQRKEAIPIRYEATPAARSFQQLPLSRNWLIDCLIDWVSEWVLLSANSTMFSAITWREQVNFQWDDAEVRFELDQQLEFYSASSLKQQSAGSRHASPLGHIILIPSQPVFALSP